MNGSKSKALSLLQAAVIVAAGVWVFWPAIHGGWIWDDYSEIPGNRILSDPAGIRKIWFSPDSLDYFPLKATAQWAEWHLWGGRVEGYHLVNIGLHLLSAFLLWHLLRKLGVGKCAWLGGLIFAVHPLVVESVAWISEFKNTLSLPPLLLAMIWWIDYDEGWSASRRRRDYLLSLLCFLAAMLCKTSVVMFPLAILLYCWWKRGRIGRSDLWASAPFFVISLILGLVTIWFQQHRVIAGQNLFLGGFLPRFAGAGLAVAFYLWKYLFPVGLLPNYPPWTLNPPAFWEFWPWVVMGGAILWLLRWSALTPTRLIGAETGPARWGQRAPPSIPRHIIFGLGFFILNLAPVLGFVPMVYLRVSRVADHFAYLPMIGLIGLTAAVIGKVESGRKKVETVRSNLTLAVGKPVAALGATFLIPLFTFLIWQSHRYAGIFRSDETLWTYTLEHNSKSWLAHSSLGLHLAQAGHLREAIGHYEAGLRLAPEDVQMNINLGNALIQSSRAPEAIAHYETALRLDPNDSAIHINLGYALAQSGRLPEAISHYETALRLDPNNLKVHIDLGIALAQSGRLPEAISHSETALRLDPNNFVIHYNLGCMLAQSGRWQEARAEFEEVLRLRPDYAAAREQLDRIRRQGQ